MEPCALKQKGQLSVEFALILITIILYITTLVQPTLIFSEEISKETFGLGYITLAAEKIVNTIDFVQSSGGETRQTINIFVPENGRIYCHGIGESMETDQNKIVFDLNLTSGLPSGLPSNNDPCPKENGTGNPTCHKEFSPQTRAGIECGVGFPAEGVPGPAQLNVQISKTSNNTVEPVEIKLIT